MPVRVCAASLKSGSACHQQRIKGRCAYRHEAILQMTVKYGGVANAALGCTIVQRVLHLHSNGKGTAGCCVCLFITALAVVTKDMHVLATRDVSRMIRRRWLSNSTTWYRVKTAASHCKTSFRRQRLLSASWVQYSTVSTLFHPYMQTKAMCIVWRACSA